MTFINETEHWKICYDAARELIIELQKKNLALEDKLYLCKSQIDLFQPLVNEHGKAS